MKYLASLALITVLAISPFASGDYLISSAAGFNSNDVRDMRDGQAATQTTDGQAGTGSNTQNPPAGQTGSGSNTAPGKVTPLKNPLKVSSVAGLVQNFVEIFSYIVILFAVLMLIWVGFQFILARGNSSKMTELKGWLLWIVVGVAVVIGARIIIQVVINTLSATGTVDQRTLQSVQRAVDGN